MLDQDYSNAAAARNGKNQSLLIHMTETRSDSDRKEITPRGGMELSFDS